MYRDDRWKGLLVVWGFCLIIPGLELGEEGEGCMLSGQLLGWCW